MPEQQQFEVEEGMQREPNTVDAQTQQMFDDAQARWEGAQMLIASHSKTISELNRHIILLELYRNMTVMMSGDVSPTIVKLWRDKIDSLLELEEV